MPVGTVSNVSFKQTTTTHTPQLEILPPREKSLARYLLPVAALVWRGVLALADAAGNIADGRTGRGCSQKTAARTFSKGDVYRSGKREIRTMAGDAQLTETAGKVRIAATTLTADFRFCASVLTCRLNTR